jgi:hypothetical protein
VAVATFGEATVVARMMRALATAMSATARTATRPANIAYHSQ